MVKTPKIPSDVSLEEFARLSRELAGKLGSNCNYYSTGLNVMSQSLTWTIRPAVENMWGHREVQQNVKDAITPFREFFRPLNVGITAWLGINMPRIEVLLYNRLQPREYREAVENGTYFDYYDFVLNPEHSLMRYNRYLHCFIRNTSRLPRDAQGDLI